VRISAVAPSSAGRSSYIAASLAGRDFLHPN
jgi:hypothetical protein